MAKRRTRTSGAAPRAARKQLASGTERLGRSLAKVEAELRRTERKIEAEARKRIRELRKEAKKQLAVIRGHERQARRLLTRLSTAGEESWGELKRAAYRAIAEARTVADSVMERFRRAAGGS